MTFAEFLRLRYESLEREFASEDSSSEISRIRSELSAVREAQKLHREYLLIEATNG